MPGAGIIARSFPAVSRLVFVRAHPHIVSPG